MPGIAQDEGREADDEVEEGSPPDVIMAAVFQSSRLGVAWYDSAHGEVRCSHTGAA